MIKNISLFLIGLLAIAAGAISSLPASWLGVSIKKLTGDKIFLADTNGDFWSGSAFMVRDYKSNKIFPILPGRFVWNISPKLLFGYFDGNISNKSLSATPIEIKGWVGNLRIQESQIKLNRDFLSQLGAPFNTIRPRGSVLLAWDDLILVLEGKMPKIYGKITLKLTNLVTNLSPVKPLGDYLIELNLQGESGDFQLSSLRGPLLLSGEGIIEMGSIKFSGLADAETEKERLKNLMNLLGQWETLNGRDVVTLEF